MQFMETLTLICMYCNEFVKHFWIKINFDIFVVHKLKNKHDLTLLRL